MREYETTFIVQPEISEDGCQELLTRIDGILERGEGERLFHDDWGKRRLAYEIEGFQKGRYVTTFYLSEGKAVEPLELALRLDESILRFLTVMTDEEVADLDARRVEAAEEQRVRAERARERAEREAEEDKARQEAARAAAAEAEKAAAAAAAAAEAAPAQAEADAASPAEGESAAAAAEPAEAGAATEATKPAAAPDAPAGEGESQ